MSCNFGIFGFGTVGQATASRLKENDYIFVDPAKKGSSSNSETLKCKAIFVCVNTQYDEIVDAHDHSNLLEILDFLSTNKYKGITVVRTTCNPHLLKSYHQQLKLIAMPEFLNQNTAFEDEKNLPIILGGDINIIKQFENLLDGYYYNDHIYCTFDEAMYFKLTRNLYGAYKVLFWNFVQDFTKNARKMYQLYKILPDQGDMEQVGMDGERGFGGKCFPKDLKIVYNSVDCNLKQLPRFMIEYNQFLKQNKI